MNRPTKRSLTVVGVVMASLVLMATAARAANFDNMLPTSSIPFCYANSTPCQTDNNAVTAYASSTVNSTSWAHIKNVLNVQFGTTDLNVTYPTSPVYTGSSETDIIYGVSAAQVPAGAVGVYECDDPVSSTKCDQGYVWFVSNTYAQNDTVSCHETGHAVGLTHGSDASPPVSDTAFDLACMRTPWGFDTSVGIGAHNTAEINVIY